jgi:hypothetical protein
MKKSTIGIFLYCIMIYVIPGFSQSTVKVDGPILPVSKLTSMSDDVVSKPVFSVGRESEEHQSRPGGIVAGAVLISAGAALGITGQVLGKQEYHKYQHSAFTENTNTLHKRVNVYNVMRIAGGLCGGTGLVVIIFSF